MIDEVRTAARLAIMKQNYEGSGNFWVAEFGMKKRLAELGFTEPLSELDEETAQIYLEIGLAIETEQNRQNELRGRG